MTSARSTWRFTGLVCLLMTVLLQSPAFGAPGKISYQGVIFQGGVPAPDGSYKLAFAVYGSAVGGAPLWSEVQPSIPVSGGVFSVMLGSVTTIPPSLFDGSSRWLQTTVNDTIVLTRNEVGTVPYAIHSSLADTALAEANGPASPILNVRSFGAKGDGVADDTGPIQTAIEALPQEGGTVYLPPGTYQIGGVVIRKDFVRLIGASRGTVIRSNGGAQALVTFSGSEGGIEDIFFLGNGHSVTAIDIQPSPDDPMKVQGFNRFANLHIQDCADGIVMTPAKDCYYNVFDTIHIINVARGIYLRNSGGASPNRNQFYSIRIGNPSTVTGLEIQAGDSNSFYGCSFEGISQTAVYIHSSPTAGTRCFGTSFEGNAQPDIVDLSGAAEFYGTFGAGLDGDLRVPKASRTVMGDGTASIGSVLKVAGGDLSFTAPGTGLVVKGANGNCYRITVDSNGKVTAAALPSCLPYN